MRTKLLMIAATCSLTVAGLVASPASATSIDDATPAAGGIPDPHEISAAREIGARSASGHLTDADREWLKAHPAFIRLIPDPARTTVGEETSTIAPSNFSETASAAAASTCKVTNRYQNYHDVLGILVWRYHTRVKWCYDKKKITSIPEKSHFFTDIDPSNYPREDGKFIRVYNINAKTKEVHSSQRIESCAFRIGCVYSVMPWNRVKVNNAGSVSFTWGT
jgi:hypothetical protein